MIPGRRASGFLTRRGRLRNRWAEALTQPDPARSLQLLREVHAEFDRNPAVFASLWLPFLNSLLTAPAAGLLTLADLQALERTGELVAGQPPPRPSLDEVFRPLIQVRDVRNEPHAACALLTRMYRSPSVGDGNKAEIARELARRGARGDDDLVVYVEHLRRIGRVGEEPQMLALLTDCLIVGFTVETLRVKRAGELARSLRAAGLTLPGQDLAQGYACLLIERRPDKAAEYLEAAYRATPGDETALVGLLSAWLHGGRHTRIAAMAREAERQPSTVARELIALSAVLAWLDDLTAESRPATKAAELAGAGIATQAGEWLPFAVGRLHLLEGNAGQAAEVLGPLALANPDRLEWNYHAAWALLLSGNGPAVAHRFFAAPWWPVGCLVMDVDPSLAGMVVSELEDGKPLPACVRVRQAIIEHDPAPERLGQPAGETLAEQLESLRVLLGQCLIERRSGEAGDAMAGPLFRRLPLAEQLRWAGLARLPADPRRGRVLLARSAHTLAHPRATLALAVHDLEELRYAQGRRLAEQVRDRANDPALAVALLWAGAHVDSLEKLAAQGDPRAHYALGSVYLGHAAEAAGAGQADRVKLFAGQAAVEFGASVRDGARLVPGDAATLAYCAQAISGQTDASTVGEPRWPEVETWHVSRQRPWVSWIVALTTLATAPATVPVAACECLVSLLEDAPEPHPVAVSTVAHALTLTCLSTTDLDRAGEIAALLARLAQRLPGPEVHRAHSVVLASLRRQRWSAGEEQGVHVADDAEPLLLLLGAEHALRGGERAVAARYLRRLPGDNRTEHVTGRLVAGVLADRPTGTVKVGETPPGVPEGTALALRIAHAAALAKTDSALCLDVLAPALRTHELTGYVDLSKSLPLLCAKAVRDRRMSARLAPVVRALATDGELDPLVLARCAVVVGEHETATAAWRRALEQGAAERGNLREEYVGFLRHEAVIARQRGRDLDAAHYLRLAARATAGTGLDRLIPTMDEVKRLEADVRDELRNVHGEQREAGQKRVMDLGSSFRQPAGVDSLDSFDEEAKRLLHFTQLEAMRPGTSDGPDGELRELAHRLHLEVCTARLLTHLFPGDGQPAEPAGRHRVLEDVVDSSPKLQRALIDEDADAALREWATCLRDRGDDLPFHHAMAATYRERALAEVASTGTSGSALVFATTLWTLLLSTTTFWAQFDHEAEERPLLSAQVARELLALHRMLGSQDFAAGRREAAQAHLRCLVACSSGGAALVGNLRDFGLPYQHVVDKDLMAEVSTVGAEVLREWSADVLRVAQEFVDDPEAIGRLPDGISKNFEGGLGHLEPFAGLGVRDIPLLRTGLEWYNEWSYCLYAKREIGQLRKLLEPARAFADQLVPLCEKQRGHLAENQILSTHFLLRGFALFDTDSAAAKREFEESLAWNPANGNARKLVVDAAAELVTTEAQQGKFVRAHEILNSVTKFGDHDEISKVRRLVHQHHAESLYRQGRFEQAKAIEDEGLSATVTPGENDRAEFRSQLSTGLNNIAVEELNTAGRHLSDFASAINGIMDTARSQLPGHPARDFPPALAGTECAVCEKPYRKVSGNPHLANIADVGGALSSLAVSGRARVVRALQEKARAAGVFQVTNVREFWREFEDELCESCRAKLASISPARTNARRLLREALRLDPGNGTARNNLDSTDEE